MGLEQRGNATYYYRKKRRGVRVVSEYVGRGELAQFAALIDGSEKRDRKRMRVGNARGTRYGRTRRRVAVGI